MTPNSYSIAASRRGKPSFTIRGISDTKTPHKACPDCYADCTSTDPGPLLEYTCPRGHQFTGILDDGLKHSKWIAHFFTGQDGYHR